MSDNRKRVADGNHAHGLPSENAEPTFDEAYARFQNAVLQCQAAAVEGPDSAVAMTSAHRAEADPASKPGPRIVSGQIVGLGVSGYRLALEWHRERIANEGGSGT